MRKRSFVIVGLLGVLIGAVANLPLSWVASSFIPKNSLPSLQYGGTVWTGHVTGFPGLGPIAINSSPIKAITGKPFLTLKTKSRNLSAKGAAKPGLLKDVVITGNMDHVAAIDTRFVGLAGDFQMTLKEMAFGEVCESASGTVSTNVLTKNKVRLQWEGPDLSGPIICQGGDFIMEFSGQDNLQSIKAVVRVIPDGNFRADITVLTKDKRAGTVLPLFGFQSKDNGYSLRESGRWM